MNSNCSAYDENGWIQIENVIPLDFISECRSQISEVVFAVAESHGVDLSSHPTLNEQFNAICAHDRALGGMVYDCMRYHPLMQRMSTEPKIVEIACELLKPKRLFHVHDQLHFRIDRSGEDRFQLQWHQDYWFNNTSTRAVTVWIPLFETTVDMGPMQIIDGSHRDATKVRIDPKYKTNWDMNKLITLAEDIPYEKGRCAPCPAGSAVFLNALTMQRSGRNDTSRNRFTIVLRYADLFDAELVKKRWKAGIMPGHVSLISQRPDLISNLEELEQNGAL